ncbi:MAG: DNA repair protein RadC [Bacteroidaceae bacterium]|nr:DNA repair protein RadC [Bacteroidaceae bacterium]
MSEKLNINQWAEDDRPREKMMRHGAAALSNAELLAILIGSGNTEENAVALMQRVMKACGDSLVRLGRMSMEELVEYPGIGPAKAISILAACELGNRRVMDRTEQPVIKSAQQVYEYYYPLLCDEAAEYSYALLLNQASRVIKNSLIGKGGLSETLVDVRVVLREALINKASSFILCHNHPGGSLRPSRQDDQLTQKVREAASLMNIRLVDHVIFTTSGYYSYADEGRI